jgi:hypothetical protein
MAEHMTRDDLVARLVRAGELEVSGDDQAEVDTYFAEGFRFHGPDGFASSAPKPDEPWRGRLA